MHNSFQHSKLVAKQQTIKCHSNLTLLPSLCVLLRKCKTISIISQLKSDFLFAFLVLDTKFRFAKRLRKIFHKSDDERKQRLRSAFHVSCAWNVKNQMREREKERLSEREGKKICFNRQLCSFLKIEAIKEIAHIYI